MHLVKEAELPTRLLLVGLFENCFQPIRQEKKMDLQSCLNFLTSYSFKQFTPIVYWTTVGQYSRFDSVCKTAHFNSTIYSERHVYESHRISLQAARSVGYWQLVLSPPLSLSLPLFSIFFQLWSLNRAARSIRIDCPWRAAPLSSQCQPVCDREGEKWRKISAALAVSFPHTWLGRLPADRPVGKGGVDHGRGRGSLLSPSSCRTKTLRCDGCTEFTFAQSRIKNNSQPSRDFSVE